MHSLTSSRFSTAKRTAVRALVLAVLLAIVPFPANAGAADIDWDYPVFDPTAVTLGQGLGVTWHNTDSPSRTHTSTGNAPLSLWSSGNVGNGGTYSRTFDFAGGYAYHCSLHPQMKGTIRVPIKATPMSGPASTVFVLRIGTQAVNAGFRMIIQIKRPGRAWAAWRTITGATTTFRANQPGTYRFKAQLQRISNGAKSGFSPVRRIQIVP